MISRKAIMLLPALLTILLPVLSPAGTLELPQTGQTGVFYTGDDGDIQAGVAWPDPRFTVTYCNTIGPCADQSSDCDDYGSNDVVVDNLTGLMWARDGNLPDEALTLSNAIDYINSMNGALGLCGYTDWHLSNVNEIQSIVNVTSDTHTWLNDQGFINKVKSKYWSSTTYATNTDYVLYTGLGDDTSIKLQPDWYVAYVWPVRVGGTAPAPVWRTGQTGVFYTGDDGDIQAGVAWPDPRFTVTYCNAIGPCADQSSDCDGNPSTDTVTDNLTGLMWTRNANLLNVKRNWEPALDFANNLNLGGHEDWRLPNIYELRSLIDYSQSDPALSSPHPFISIPAGTPSGIYLTCPYWSSTVYKLTTTKAWYTHMSTGLTEGALKASTELYVWPVRGGVAEQVARPVFTPAPGTYSSSQSVEITSSTPDVSIYYTTNGDDPTESSLLYVNAININETTTLKARAYKNGWKPSDIATGNYVIVSGPSFSDAAASAVLANMYSDSAMANAVNASDDPSYYPLVALYASSAYDYAEDAYEDATAALAAAQSYSFWGYYAPIYAESDINVRSEAVTNINLAAQYAAQGDLETAEYYLGYGNSLAATADLYNGVTIWCASMESSGQAAAQQSSASSEVEPSANGTSTFSSAATNAVLANMNFATSVTYAVSALDDPSDIPLVQLYASTAYDYAEAAHNDASAALDAAGQDATFWGTYAVVYAESDMSNKADALSAFDQAVQAYYAGDLATAYYYLGYGFLPACSADLYNATTIWCASMESEGGTK